MSDRSQVECYKINSPENSQKATRNYAKFCNSNVSNILLFDISPFYRLAVCASGHKTTGGEGYKIPPPSTLFWIKQTDFCLANQRDFPDGEKSKSFNPSPFWHCFRKSGGLIVFDDLFFFGFFKIKIHLKKCFVHPKLFRNNIFPLVIVCD